MKIVIETQRRRRRRRLDLFRALCLFLLFAMPLSLLYQISVHYLEYAPVLATANPADPERR